MEKLNANLNVLNECKCTHVTAEYDMENMKIKMETKKPAYCPVHSSGKEQDQELLSPTHVYKV